MTRATTAAGAGTPLASARAPQPGGGRRRPGEQWWAWLMIAPLGLGLLVFYLWPLVRTFYFSFTEWGPFGGHEWTGFANYARLFDDPDVLSALRNTFLFTGLSLLGIPLAIVVAALLNQRGLRGAGAYRILYFLPVVTMPAAIAMVWRFLFNGDFGLLNYGLSLVGIDGQNWISDGRFALYALVVVGIWMSLGYNIVILLAGMQGIPRELYEAASLDGAGPVRQFLSVTLPMLSPSIFFVSVVSLIGSMQMFDLVYVMIGRTNPALPDTRTIVYLYYQKAFIENDRGYASAIVFVLLAIILVLTALQFSIQRRWVHYD